ncbi:MAG: SIMPL domain-containing protein [Gemmatimonadetes bacterium]|nr:SIMPL domain-containing protein [Gemmatimonadota bacterium]
MNRLTCILIALSLSACASVPAPAAAQRTAPEVQDRTIFVNATTQVRRAPDQAVISLAVETPAPSAAEATRQNADRMSAVIEAVRRLGIDRSRIQTRRVELMPQYERMDRMPPDRMPPMERVEPREPRIVGYIAVNQVVVTVDDVGLVGRVVDAGVEAGANRVTGIHFQLREPESAYHEAVRMAVQKARREAEVIAAALGEPLGPALNVTTSSYYPIPQPTPMMRDMRMEQTAAMPTPVEPGELDVQATVSITFRIGT